MVRVLALLAGIFLPIAALSQPLTVVASNDVLAYMVARLAGPEAEVSMPVAEGDDPAAWQPTIAEIAAVQAADLIVLNGADYEGWAGRVSLPRARTVEVTHGWDSDLIAIKGQSHSHGAGEAHSHDGIAPLLWLDFKLAARYANTLAAALARRAPDAQIDANLAALRADLSALDAEATVIGVTFAGTTLLTWQPGYEYFGRAYGFALREVTFDRDGTPSEAQIAKLKVALSETGARAMLWDAPPPEATAKALESLGVRIVVLPTAQNVPPGTDIAALWRTGLADLSAALFPQ
ncbi:MAG: metal ABC transporter substrate-binding protein [Gemmobacter sp.]